MAQRLPFTSAQYVARLISQDGTCESPAGSNVQPYSKAMGHGAEPWCGDFIAWGMKTLGFDISTPIPSFAWTPTLPGHMSTVLGWEAVTFDALRAGDVVFLNFDADPTIDHVAVVTGPPSKAGTVPTIEGNTTREGETRDQANGGRVAQRLRSRANFVCARRPLYAVPVVPSSAPASPGVVHTVTAGETLSTIAARYRTTWERIYGANRAKIGPNPDVLAIGLRLLIPSTVIAHTVTSGETLSSIAARYGTTWQRIYAVNRTAIGSNPNVLAVGTRLRIA